MIFKFQRNPRGHAALEYMLLIMFVIGSMLVMQKYLSRSNSGRLKSVGDSMGYGRQYDVEKTLECGYYVNSDSWYSMDCYDQMCDCESDAVKCFMPECAQAYIERCHKCKKTTCFIESCQQ